jgi:hypothetical protein
LIQSAISIRRRLRLLLFFIAPITIGFISPDCRADDTALPSAPLIPDKHFNINDYGAAA